MSTHSDPGDFQYHFLVGIDLGTTNSAVAYVEFGAEQGEAERHIQYFEIPQLVAPAEMAVRAVLPSFLYLPGQHDLPAGSSDLPWAKSRDYIVGEFAREQGSKVPSRLISSAKSWLCHAGVERTNGILPWGSEEEIRKHSPVEASTRYLEHIREAWNKTIADGSNELNLEEQFIVLTVPASFDEVARELTLAAARAAGLTNVTLLEEPLAAFYAWLSKNEDSWQDTMSDGELILVCDVGGGTTDLSVIGIQEGENGLRFNRLAVGEHLMLGGDNMDLTLARYAESKIAGQPGKLEARKWNQLVHACRHAKETLLGSRDAPEETDITIIDSGSKLIAGTLKSKLTQNDIDTLIVDGFFPKTEFEETPAAATRQALTEFGLPYVKDPAISRHLSDFWHRFKLHLARESGRDAVFPDYVLFNGKAISPQRMRNRVSEILGDWFAPTAGDGWRPHELENLRPDLAVAVGAAYYGRVRLGEGVRIGSGSPRAFYMNLSGELGTEQPEEFHTLCLLPRGTEEGFEVELAEQKFDAVTNQPVSVQLFSSSSRLGDQLGDVVQLPAEEATQLPPIRTVLKYGKKNTAKSLPVQLSVKLTEVGTLELWCQSIETSHQWQLQFDVRQISDAPSNIHAGAEVLDQALVEAVLAEVDSTFQPGNTGAEHSPAELMARLAILLGDKKETWPTLLIRKIADALLENPNGRGLSRHHEERWLSLLSYCLRPGFGDPADELRIKQAWRIYLQGLRFPNRIQSRLQWWMLWGRVAGGLKSGQQLQVYQNMSKNLTSPKLSKKLHPHEKRELWISMASLERLPAEAKSKLGDMLLATVGSKRPKSQELWALSRLGTRTPVYGPADRVVATSKTADWLHKLLKLKPDVRDSTAHALVHLVKPSGDRVRDVGHTELDAVTEWLSQLERGEHFQSLLSDSDSNYDAEDKDWLFGEALPPGLVLFEADGADG